MVSTRDYLQENNAARRELGDMVARLDQRSLALPAGSAGTIASLLCHLAFWDQRMVHLLGRWQQGPFEPSSLSSLSADSINHAVITLAQAVPGAAAAQLAFDSAAAVDAAVAAVSDELAAQILGAGLDFVLHRHLHRRAHLRQIQQALDS